MVSVRSPWRYLRRPSEVEDLPAEALQRPAGPPPDAATAQRVMRLCLRVGDLLLEAGMAANDLVVVLVGIGHAYRVTPIHVDVTYTSITISYYPDLERDPLSLTRVVQPGVPDYFKAQQTNAV